MKNGKKLICFFFLLIGVQNVFSDDGSSGCGLGKMAAPSDSLISTTTAMAINMFIPSQPSATTTGTSGCARHSLVKKDQNLIYYAHVNYDLIEFDASQGSGEHLFTLAHQFGCNNHEQGLLFAQEMRKNFKKVFNDGADGYDLYKRIKNVLAKSHICSERRV